MPSKLHEDRAAVWAQMEEKIKAGADTWSPEDTTAYEAMEADYRSLTSRIEAEDRFAKLAAPTGPPIPQNDEKQQAEQRAAEYASAYDAYVRFGENRLTAEQRDLLVASEQRTMSTTTNSEGGYLVPTEVRATIIEALKTFGGVRRHATVITTDSGNTINMPTNDDTGNVGEIVAENAEVTDLDVALGVKTIGAFIYSSKMVKAPVSLLEDSAVDLDAFIPKKQGERIGRLQATHFMTGTGTGQPEGLITGRDTSLDVNTTAAFTYTNIVDLTLKIDPAYKDGAVFLMNANTQGGVRKLVDTTGRPLWEPSMQVGMPDRILGYPVDNEQGLLDDASTGAVDAPILFGNLKEAYIIRDVKGIANLRLTELYARFRQVAFIAFIRTDGRVVNNKAYAVIERTA